MRTVKLADGTTQDVHDGQARTLVRLGQASYADEQPAQPAGQPATPYPPPQIPGTAPGTTDTPPHKPAAARKRSTKVPGARRVVRRSR